MAITISCPSCGYEQSAPADYALHDRLKCARCGAEFAVPAETSSPTLTPKSALPEGGATFSVLQPAVTSPRDVEDRYPEESRSKSRGVWDDETPFEEKPRSGSRPEWVDDNRDWAPSRVEEVSNQYSIDLGAWFRPATAHWSCVLGPMIGFLYILGFISAAAARIPYRGGLVLLLIVPPLQAGFVIVALAQLQGRRWDFNDFFRGFAKYGTLLGYTILLILCVVGAALPAGLAAYVVVKTAGSSPVVNIIAIVLGVVALLVSCYVGVRTGTFGVMLIIDRHFEALEALQGSWRMTRNHFWGLFGLQLLLGLINLAGVLLFGVGVLFTFPLTILVLVAGYLLVAGKRPPVERPSSIK